MSSTLALVLLLAGEACPAEAAPPEANAFVRSLVGGQQRNEEALSHFTYDVKEVRERLVFTGCPPGVEPGYDGLVVEV